VVAAKYDPAFYAPGKALLDQLAAVSVGVVDEQVRLDLDYDDDSRAAVDLNVARTAAGRFVEIQGSAENGLGFSRSKLDELLDMASAGCEQLLAMQKTALTSGL